MDVAAKMRELDGKFSALHPGYDYTPISSAIDYFESLSTLLPNDRSVLLHLSLQLLLIRLIYLLLLRLLPMILFLIYGGLISLTLILGSSVKVKCTRSISQFLHTIMGYGH